VVRPATVELAPGELCLLFSDGLTGARGDEPFGEARLREALSGCRDLPGEAAVERLGELVSDWVRGGPHDDIAMLAIRAPSRTALSLRGGGVAAASPFAIDAHRTDRRPRQRT
jgi:serine phosphatase RsbU (regulator of sigma subunit)